MFCRRNGDPLGSGSFGCVTQFTRGYELTGSDLEDHGDVPQDAQEGFDVITVTG